MLFEIIDREGNRSEWTENEKCILGKDSFQQRMKDGYTLKLNGTVVKTYDKLQELLEKGRG